MESVLGALQECCVNMLRFQSPLSAQGGSAPSFRNTGFQVCSEVHLALERVAVTVEGSWDCSRVLSLAFVDLPAENAQDGLWETCFQ